MGLQRIISTKKGIIFVFVGFLVFSWIFSGCLQIGKFPPEIKKALADSTAEYPSANNGGWDADESNAYTDDTSYASTTPNTNSTESVEYGSFGFDSLIPTGSTINSVTIELVWYMSTSASNATLRVDALVNNGVVGTQESDTTEPTSDKTTSYENDYGSWSRDDLLDGVFEVRVGAQRGGGSTGYTMYLDYVKVTVDYSALTTPTVSTQAASSVEISTATGNGNIISTGGENADKRGFVYDTSTKSLPGNVAPTSSGYAYYAEDSGSYGTGAFTKGLSSLSANVTYYIRAYAHNSAGYSYGGEVNFLTKPDSPSTINFTNICLDSLRINWIAPAGGASSYKIERCEGTGCSDFLQITSGETNVYYDDSGLSAGTTYRYRVRATNATGDSDYCAPDETTTEAASISIVVEDGSGTVSYGIVNTSQNTTSSGVDQTQTVRNNGNVAEDFDIKGQDSEDWILAGVAGDASYKHEWCTSSCDSSPIWNVMTTTYDSDYLSTNIPVDGTVSFDLKITIPTANPGTNQQTVDVFVRATQH